MKNLIFLILILLFIFSCSGSNYLVKQNGDGVEITSLSGMFYEGEILALSNEEMFIIQKYKKGKSDSYYYRVASIDLDKIKSVTVKGYSDREWSSGVLFMQIIPAFTIGLVGGLYNHDIGIGLVTIGLGLSIPGIITYFIFDAASPYPPEWKSELNDRESIKNLNIYARLPKGITETKLDDLLKYYNQQEIYKLK